MPTTILVKRLPSAEDLPLPSYQTAHSAGMDLIASEDLWVEPGERQSVGTGLCFAIPDGHELQVRPRSGLAIKHGITLLNTPGTIDADYRGEVRILVINHGNESFRICRGDRIAQAILAPVHRGVLSEVGELPQTERGAGGFGSTGK